MQNDNGGTVPSKTYMLLSRLGAELLCHPLSEDTRKRQTTLLLASAVSLLLSYSVITPEKVSAVFLQAAFHNSDMITLLCGLLSA